jgi:hypothetical protein
VEHVEHARRSCALLRDGRSDVLAKDAGGPAMGRSRIRRRHPASAAGVRRTGICSPLGGFRSAQGMRSVWLGDRVAKLTSYYP